MPPFVGTNSFHLYTYSYYNTIPYHPLPETATANLDLPLPLLIHI